MSSDLTLLKHLRGLCARAVTTSLALGAAVAVCPPAVALAQLNAPIQIAVPPVLEQTKTYCGTEVKEAVAQALASVEEGTDSEKLAMQAQLYEKFQGCTQDAQLVAPTSTFFLAARQCGAAVSSLGSIFFEEMSCCGYDPQRREFACPVKIKQPFGFGGAPLPGSREHVLHCVADANGVLQPVGHDSVHLANAVSGAPSWQFAVIAAANENLYTVQPMAGQTRRARSILSWALQPNNCNYQPIWGNALNYHIRLDQ